MTESIATKDAKATELAQVSRATLASLFLAVERKHDRPAVVERRLASGTERTPDWRFHRHIMRVALYLRERCGLKKDERVALVAPLCPEWLLFDWATVIQGATTVVLDASASDAQLSAAWGEHSPRVALVETEAEGARLLALGRVAGSLEHVISLASTAGAGVQDAQAQRAVPFVEALDLGGTLDTAERANVMRAQARAIGAGQVAAVYPHIGESLTNGDIAGRIRMRASLSTPSASRKQAPARGSKEAVVHVAEGTPVGPTLHIALYGYVADGSTCTAFGEREVHKQEVRHE